MSSSSFNVMPAGMESDEEDNDGFYKDLSVRKTCENLKITVVPDITANAGLNGRPFDATLEPEVKLWMDQLKSSLFSHKKGPTLTNALLSFYAQCSNPFLYCLKMYANCSGINSLKTNSFAYALIEELYNYKKTNQINSGQFVDDNIKTVAFNFVKKQSQQLVYKMIAQTFDLIASKYLFVDNLKEMIAEHHYKEVCQFAYELQLYNEFTIYEFILPLILQDKISIAEGYLNKAKHMQRPLIELLDSLLEKPMNLQNKCSHYISQYNYPDVKLYKLHAKPLMKLITRLSKMYNLPLDVMPNVIKMKNYGALQFLLNKQYTEKCLNKDSWQEMVKETIPDDSNELQMELVLGCFYNRDYAEAAYWATFYNVKVDELPTLVKEYIEQGDKTGHSPDKVQKYNGKHTSPQNRQSKEQHHTLSLDDSNIILVDLPDKFENMIKDIAHQSVIAFDAEWKPTFCAKNELALIQIATETRIYLIDVIQLRLTNDEWNQLGDYIFNNIEILKIGFSPANDLILFQKTIPSLNLSSQYSSAYLDLQELWRKLNNMPKFAFPYEGDTQATALGALVKLCLGKKLNKSNQFSNWEKRPLRTDQMNYAALDAYCLIEIYRVIKQQIEQIDVDFNEFINCFITDKKAKVLTKKSSSLSSASASTGYASSTQGKIDNNSSNRSNYRNSRYKSNSQNH